MASIKDHLRELGVLLFYAKKEDISDKMNPNLFYEVCKERIEGFNLSINQIANSINGFNVEEIEIIKRGLSMGEHIHNKLGISKESSVLCWHGFKNEIVDISIGEHRFSLKEKSYVLKNMGLYAYLNTLLSKDVYKKGLHVFDTFSKKEHDEWLQKTIEILISQNEGFDYIGRDYISHGRVLNDEIELSYNNTEISKISKDINFQQFMKATSPKTREKVFSKWIYDKLRTNPVYLDYKIKCSQKAGESIKEVLKKIEVSPRKFISDFFNLQNESYYYAKNDGNPVLFRVPSKNDIKENTYKIVNLDYKADNQLNFLITVENINNNKILVFRNEMRYSHGQFNGTPEAKLYIDSGELDILYIKI